ncbi:phospholipase A2 inhibitor beta-like isoform X2 [Cylas formicarius]|uniref:phospholipase A2 inhibitor beta-like isoform X2 n=1 Tax=Cylas formicarius TaxID=197179 RepID=UPI002958751D|nr:phospholipase A2 inhibitor beta-like isoform X2 [Cylas formicarius]
MCLSLVFLLVSLTVARAGFLYGQPCSERNTAYLYSTTWTIPENREINCVDVTGFRNPNLMNYLEFFRLASAAHTLYADHMNLTSFPVSMVFSLPGLETLDLSGNHIRRLPYRMYKIAPSVSKLMVAENRLFVPKKRPLFVSNTVKMLMLSKNKIGHVYPVTFKRMPNLEVLYLDSNAIKCISADIFKPLAGLKYLHLGLNQIQDFPAQSLMPPQLRHYITKDQRRIKVEPFCEA